jgi:ferredoxin
LSANPQFHKVAKLGSTPGASKTFQPRQSGLSSITVTLFAFAFIGRDFAHHQPCVYLIMADKLSKHSENAPGPWYVDTSCALCRLCLEEAPNLLNYNRDETAVHFFKQPETPGEIAAAKRAMDVCPTLAIGNDG